MRTWHPIPLPKNFYCPKSQPATEKKRGTEGDTRRSRFPNGPLKYKVGKFTKKLSGKHQHNFNFPPRINECDVYNHEGLRGEGKEGGGKGQIVQGVVVDVCDFEGLELGLERGTHAQARGTWQGTR